MTFHPYLLPAQFSVIKFLIELSSVSYFVLVAHTICYMNEIYEYNFPWIRPYRMAATDVSGGTCFPRFHGLLQNNNLQIKIKRCLSVCLYH